MDTTEAIRSVKDSIKAEYVIIMTGILKNQEDNREERTAIFERLRQDLSAEAKAHFKDAVLERERIHFEFANDVFPKIYLLQFGENLPESYPKHDHSKDDLFAFTLASHFDILKASGDADDDEKVLKENMGRLMKYELKRHYTLEAHHPEHEDVASEECTDANILEMATDRLARNVQFNHGKVNKDRMFLPKFLPKFHLGDIPRKEKFFREMSEKYQDQVSQFALDMYFK